MFRGTRQTGRQTDIHTDMQQKGILQAPEGNLITHIHTYIHTYIQIIQIIQIIHTYIYTRIQIMQIMQIMQIIHSHIYVHACIDSYIHTYTHTYTYIHAYIHTYTHTHTHTHTHTYQGQSTDGQRKRNLQDFEEKLQRTEAKAEQYEARAARAMQTVNLLKQGIQLTFDKLGCNKEAVTAVLGNQGVTESNIMQVCLCRRLR
jgi:hypothetical protein